MTWQALQENCLLFTLWFGTWTVRNGNVSTQKVNNYTSYSKLNQNSVSRYILNREVFMAEMVFIRN